MKPRLIKIHGAWHCGIKGSRGPLGIGFSAREAYYDWLRVLASS